MKKEHIVDNSNGWWQRKLREADVREIVRLRNEGWLIPAIAKHIKISETSVQGILNGHRWKHVTSKEGLPPRSGRFTKLKKADVEEAIRLREKGLTFQAIAKHFGNIVSRQQIQKITSGKSRA